ncbi:NUDIX domain-containing protein [Natronomonas sp.]|uniref:NUDIX domain-containing protein n=1 Tax=Natronomonas sp. TaxID=2184060 RepID=UPI00260FE1E3|nr:NUDIX domain-containing protein [Natronomonas sp.]
MSPSASDLVARYGEPYRKSERIELPAERFRKGVERGDDGAWGVGALVVHDGAALLVREGETWLLPGGRLESGESAEAGAKREVREETGLEIAIDGLAAIAEQTFLREGSDECYEFRFATFFGEPSVPDPRAATGPDDPAIDETAWRGELPQNTFDRGLVRRLLEARV